MLPVNPYPSRYYFLVSKCTINCIRCRTYAARASVSAKRLLSVVNFSLAAVRLLGWARGAFPSPRQLRAHARGPAFAMPASAAARTPPLLTRHLYLFPSPLCGSWGGARGAFPSPRHGAAAVRQRARPAFAMPASAAARTPPLLTRHLYLFPSPPCASGGARCSPLPVCLCLMCCVSRLGD